VKSERAEKMEFKGVDWTELAIHFEIIDKDYQGGIEEDEQVIKKTQDFLNSSLLTENEQEVAKALRNFLSEFIVNAKDARGGSYPLWKGLAEVEDDLNLIRFTAVLLPYLWI
jgi:hypothetical protein